MMAYNYRMSQPVGFQKLAFAPRLTGAALGAGLGAAAAPEDEGWTGAALGGLAGYGLGAGADYLTRPFRPTGAAAPPAPESAAVGAPSSAPAAVPGPAVSREPLSTKLVDAYREKVAPIPGRAADAYRQHIAPIPGRVADAYHARLSPTVPSILQAAGAKPRGGVAQGIRETLKSVANKPIRFKKADYGLSAGIPGLSVSQSGKDERLEGMNRWVPRTTLEQAYQGLEQGLDQQALLEQAADAGHLKHPAVGAGLAAALAQYGLPSSHAGLKALAGFAGGGVGAIYNKATAPTRVEDMRQAIRGVSRERAKQPSAREAMPMVMSSSGDDV